MNTFFGLLMVAGIAACLFGLAAILLSLAFDRWNINDWWTIRPFILGFLVAAVGGAGFWATKPATPLSRGIVADKVERSYTTMVMSGKVFVPMHHVERALISNEGARCQVSAEAFAGYRVGDAVVCGWTP